jgi:two-component system sensor histidine kinase GlrK
MDPTLSQILRHLTHELKRPLASLQQSVYLLLDEVSGPLTAEQRRILEIQLRNAKRVSSCIANLGDLSQLEAGVDTRQLASLDLGVVIEEVINGVEYELKERRITIKVDLPAATPWCSVIEAIRRATATPWKMP